MKIKWSKNGNVFENAYDITSGLRNYAFYPAVCMKNAEIKFNFGETGFDFPPKVTNPSLGLLKLLFGDSMLN